MKKLLRKLRRRPLDIELELAMRERESSFPYISGDTFRTYCDVVVDETGVSTYDWVQGQFIFCATKYAGLLATIAAETKNPSLTSSMTVLIHNGDTPPVKEVFEVLLAHFKSVYSVNATYELEALGILPLPIGLENLHWNNNGVLKNYPLQSDLMTFSNILSRQNLILSSFNSRTNPKVREPLQELVARSSIPITMIQGTNMVYVENLRNSIFVISPQGNGFDCHRTWEAFYSGAIPVVTEGTLSRSLTDQLPILVVPTWNDFFKLNENELRQEARRLSGRPRDSGYMPYWLSEFGIVIPD